MNIFILLSPILTFLPVLQLLSHPFVTKYEDAEVNLEAFVQSIFDPTQRMKDLADVS